MPKVRRINFVLNDYRRRIATMKKNQFGQTSISSSFLSKSRIPNEETEPIPKKKPISLSDFLNKKVASNDKSIKEKKSSFSTIGSLKNESKSQRDEIAGDFIIDKSVFKRFNEPIVKEASVIENSEEDPTNETSDSKKRKNPFCISSDEPAESQAKRHVVVLGDDPKPKPTKVGKGNSNERARPFYNHYENGRGWWDDNREGIDCEEVGCNDAVEGMGTTTLGGLEWH